MNESPESSKCNQVKELLAEAPHLLLKTSSQEVVQAPTSVLEGKVVCFYFSAHWCGPCRNFTPVLKKVYEEVKAEGKHAMEVVFVSSDQNDREFGQYFGSMPWTALPRGSPAGAALSSKFSINGIPSLVVIGADGKVLSRNARSAVISKGAAGFPWEGAEDGGLGDLRQNIVFWIFLAWVAYTIWGMIFK